MKNGQNLKRILAVDDDQDTLEMLQRNLSSKGYQVFTAPGVPEAIHFLEKNPVDLVITDLKMPGQSGMDLVRYVRDNLPDSEIMMITGYPSIEGAVKAVKTGAEEYLSKPFTDIELFDAVQRTLDKLHARQLINQAPRPVSDYGILGESEPMRKVFSAIEKAANTQATVLVTGESGTGKELVARAIHYRGKRASAPFVPVNCGGIPEDLLESELFGHVKGSFTGATESRSGFFQTADGGSIFLDEIGEMTPAMQVKLLRVLQDKQVTMIGSRQPRPTDIRIIAATNKDLLTAVQRGQFRDDLFYRLNVINIELPPLRDRGDDLLLLVRHFCAKFATESGRAPLKISDPVLDIFRHFPWPGNVRELENVIQRLAVMAEGDLIRVSDLPSLMRYTTVSGMGLHRTLAEVELDHIRNVLSELGGNRTKAAQILGIDRKTLREKLKRGGIEDTE